jgi:hypothetical protein
MLAYMTLCAVLAALSSSLGIAVCVCLAAIPLALWARQGLLTVALLMAACATAQLGAVAEGVGALRQIGAIAVTTALSIWFALREERAVAVDSGLNKGVETQLLAPSLG